ncbi:sulfur-oxidizing protein SoxA [Roseateles sp. YR242]|uniref:sulfur oxidation c-type cytochrome SoxA n=1 Tax=Roseateles sp. YR242 TaxID=1855305 RepID=UPI0008B38935|nr:sulfur oxidation c-type cytochrome SoxA [Roseateles sp. YR242]SEL77366.1 sulfur-oxidizing protein SoxA [Roseateles sp. YR242]
MLKRRCVLRRGTLRLALATLPWLLGAGSGGPAAQAQARARALSPAQSASMAAPAQRSGFDFMTPALKAMQRSDAQNPAMLWVASGADLWKAAPTNGKPACAGCHASGLAGTANRYPAFSDALQRPVTLLQQINRCRTTHQEQAAWPNESEPLLALAAYIGQQSRGLPIDPPEDERLTPWRQAGEALYRARIGQLNLSCAQCHEDRAGQRLAGAVIPSGLATGYPLYRLEWQGLGSLPRRLLNCTTGVRAAPLNEEELTQVELYLMQRANGLPLETPAVRP